MRETGEVYRMMGSNPNLSALEVDQKEYKGHRRVFDSGISLVRAQYRANKMPLESLLAAAFKKMKEINGWKRVPKT